MTAVINNRAWQLWRIPSDSELYMNTTTYEYVGKEFFDTLSTEEKSYYVPDYNAEEILTYLDKNLGIRVTVRSCDDQYKATIDLDGRHYETDYCGSIKVAFYDITLNIVNYFYDKKIKEAFANY